MALPRNQSIFSTSSELRPLSLTICSSKQISSERTRAEVTQNNQIGYRGSNP